MECKATQKKEVNEKTLHPEMEIVGIKSEKNDVEYENATQCSNKIAENLFVNLKTESCSKVAVSRILSESEASSCFETISSADSKMYASNLDLSSTADDDFNEVVEIENELAYQNHKDLFQIVGSNERSRRDKRNTPIRSNYRTDGFLSSSNSRRQNNFRVVNKEQKYWQGSVEDKCYKYDKRDKKSAEREAFDCSSGYRRYNFHEHVWGRGNNRGRNYRHSRNDHDFKRRHSRSSDSDSGPRCSRSSDRESTSKNRTSIERDYRLRRSRSNDHDSRTKRSRSGSHYSRFGRSRSRSRASRSPEWKFRPKSPGNKLRKTEANSRNFEKSTAKPNSNRNSQPRNTGCNSFSKSPTPPIWNRFLRELRNPLPGSCNNGKNSRKFFRKSQRTPFFMDLEGKPKETDQLMNSKKDAANGPRGQPDVSTNVNDNSLVPETPQMLNQNSVPPLHQQYKPPVQNMVFAFPFQYKFPSMSTDNLPLVLGPNGVPVHITSTGEHIPHDFEGRLIPVGPNGHYLPLDPTGRLFAHVLFNHSQAVPIHMTEDGVLRLPNSAPVPYGPPHQFLVNIDGRIIPIGPDSKPLYPCPNLPRHPPPHFRKMIEGFCPEPMPQEIAQLVPQKVGHQIIPTDTIGHHYQDNVNVDERVIAGGPYSKPLYLSPDMAGQPQKMMVGPEPTPAQGIPENIGQTGNQQSISTESQKNQNSDSDQTQKVDSVLVDVIRNCSQNIGKADMQKNYRNKARKILKDVIMRVEVEENHGGISSKEGVKGSSPMKLSVKRYSEEYSSDSDMSLDTDDSDSTFCLVCGYKSKKEISITSNGDEEANPSDKIAKKVQHAIQSLCEKHYKPPVFGRFIISSFADPVPRKHPEETPLLRNRIMLPFLDPNATSSHSKDQSVTEENTEIIFKFLPQKVALKGDEPIDILCDKNSSAVNIPVFKLDFAMQCDFTSLTIKSLNSKITELEREVIILKSINTNLLKGYKNIQSVKERKSNDLRKGLINIDESENEIRELQHSAAEHERLAEVYFVN